MSRSTTGKSSFKIQRSLGIELPGLGKAGALERRPYGPGQHGNKRKKISDFAVRMKEKQKCHIIETVDALCYSTKEGILKVIELLEKVRKKDDR